MILMKSLAFLKFDIFYVMHFLCLTILLMIQFNPIHRLHFEALQDKPIENTYYRNTRTGEIIINTGGHNVWNRTLYCVYRGRLDSKESDILSTDAWNPYPADDEVLRKDRLKFRNESNEPNLHTLWLHTIMDSDPTQAKIEYNLLLTSLYVS